MLGRIRTLVLLLVCRLVGGTWGDACVVLRVSCSFLSSRVNVNIWEPKSFLHCFEWVHSLSCSSLLNRCSIVGCGCLHCSVLRIIILLLVLSRGSTVVLLL